MPPAIEEEEKTNLQDATIYDLTLPLSDATVIYPGDPPPVVKQVSSIHAGDRLTSSYLALGCHTGTHVDAPAHFLAEGPTLDGLSIHNFFGPAIVVEIPGRKRIGADDLKACAIPRNHHVLLKTDNSALLAGSDFVPSYNYLEPAAAAYLCELNARSVGIDYYSLDPFGDDDLPAHTVIAKHNLPAFVCLDLRMVPAGAYSFTGLPLRLEGVEASPVRAIVWR